MYTIKIKYIELLLILVNMRYMNENTEAVSKQRGDATTSCSSVVMAAPSV